MTREALWKIGPPTGLAVFLGICGLLSGVMYLDTQDHFYILSCFTFFGSALLCLAVLAFTLEEKLAEARKAWEEKKNRRKYYPKPRIF